MTRGGVRVFRRLYGASPAHLVLMVGCFTLALYAGPRLLRDDVVGAALWFAGAAVLHDLVLLPAYTLADRGMRALHGRWRGGASAPSRGWVNAVRVPAFLSGVLLLVWFPLILGRVDGYEAATGLSGDVYLGRWLLATAGFLAVSAFGSALWLMATRWRRRRTRRPVSTAEPHQDRGS